MSVVAVIEFSGAAWRWPAVAALILAAAALFWSSRPRVASTPVRIVCALLKWTGILGLCLCLLEPTAIRQRARPGANFFAIIADNSQSVGDVKDSGERLSRGELLKRELSGASRGWQDTLEENFQVKRYYFDSRLQGTRDFDGLNFAGRSTALGHALESAVSEWRGQPVAGVLLFTDGNATDLGEDVSEAADCPPIYPVMIGAESGVRDLSLEKAAVSQTPFEDAPVTIQAAVAAHGFAGSTVVTRLTELGVAGGFAVSNTTASPVQLTRRASDPDSVLDFRFQVHPDQPGVHFYRLETRLAEELDGQGASREMTLANNSRILAVDRGQEPFRVLFVGGRPSWEFKFLNRAIQEDHQVRMVSLMRIARREPKFEFKGRPGESSNPLFRGFGAGDEDTARYDQPVLVRLNTEDQFELRGGFPKTDEELFRYDAVIFNDVEAGFFTHDQLELLRRFVSERGGGFLMLGGAESFREGNYANTEVASILPVYLDRAVDATIPGQWKWALTREGWLQPWTRLRSTEAGENERLASMPLFEVLNPVGDVKPGATLLAVVTDSGHHTFPALAVQRYGLGRTAALTVGDLWQWGFRDETAQKDIGKCWRQLVRWLVTDVPPRISVTPEIAPADAGTGNAEIRLIVKVNDRSYKPVDNASVKLSVQPLALAGRGSPIKPGESQTNSVRVTADAIPGRPGTYEATYVARQDGPYWVEATASDADGKPAGKASAAWVSDPAADEFRSLKPNRPFLEALARRTGGRMVALSELPKFARRAPESRAPVTETWSDPIWHRPWVLISILSCFVVEWGLRRWKGLP